MKRYNVYADTSVFGGCFDPEFEEQSKAFFRKVEKAEFILIISTTLLAEINEAP